MSGEVKDEVQYVQYVHLFEQFDDPIQLSRENPIQTRR